MLRKLLAVNVKCVKVISAIGAVSEGRFLGFPVPLFLKEATVSLLHSDILDGYVETIVALAVDVWHEMQACRNGIASIVFPSMPWQIEMQKAPPPRKEN